MTKSEGTAKIARTGLLMIATAGLVAMVFTPAAAASSPAHIEAADGPIYHNCDKGFVFNCEKVSQDGSSVCYTEWNDDDADADHTDENATVKQRTCAGAPTELTAL